MSTTIDINVTPTVQDVTINTVDNVTVINVNTQSGGGGIESVTGSAVDNTDPDNPVIDIPTLQEVMETGRSYEQTIGNETYTFGFNPPFPFNGTQFATVVKNNTTDTFSVFFSSAGTEPNIGIGITENPANFNRYTAYDQNLEDGHRIRAWDNRTDEVFLNELKIPFKTSEFGHSSFSIPNNKPEGAYTLATTDDIPPSITIDATPTDGSNNAVSSNGVFDALGTKQATLTATIFGAFANSLDAITTPIDANLLNIVDTADSNKQRKVTFTNVKAFLKTYFDTLYQTILVSGTNIKTINSNSVLGSGNLAVEPTITAGTTSQYYRGDKIFQTLDKTAVGLGNVDNTSDVNKPISTATQTALDLKANQSTIVRIITPSSALTGTTIETQITSFNFTIPANTFSATDILKVETIAWEKAGVANASSCRLKLSNTNNYAGATNVLILAASGGNINMRATRTYKIAGGNLKGLMSTSANGIFNDNTLTNVAVSTLALDVTQPIFGFVSLQNSSSADSTIMNELIISKW